MTPKRSLSFLLLAAVTLFSMGCQRCNLRGNGFREPFADWGTTVRPKPKSGDRFGFSEKARQIEGDVGL